MVSCRNNNEKYKLVYLKFDQSETLSPCRVINLHCYHFHIEKFCCISGKLTCAIGDGGNDVSMIQASDAGVGLVGKVKF